MTQSTPSSDTPAPTHCRPTTGEEKEGSADQQRDDRARCADQRCIHRGRSLQRQILQRVVATDPEQARPREQRQMGANHRAMLPYRCGGKRRDQNECKRPTPERQRQRRKLADQCACKHRIAGPEQRWRDEQCGGGRRKSRGGQCGPKSRSRRVSPGLPAFAQASSASPPGAPDTPIAPRVAPPA